MSEPKVIEIEKRSPEELEEIIIKQTIKIQNLQKELNNCRNELCMKCGNYREAHLGICEDCRYARNGAWLDDMETGPWRRKE